MTTVSCRSWRLALGTMLVPVLFVLPACGDDGVLDGDSTSTTASTDTASTDTAPPTSASPTSAPPIVAAERDLDPCELLTQEQANELMGRELQPALPAGSAGDRLCIYPTPTSGSIAQVELSIGPGAKKYFDIEKELGHEFAPVAGVGDEAEIEDGTIFFRVGTTWASLRVVTLGDFAQLQPKVEELARQIAAQM